MQKIKEDLKKLPKLEQERLRSLLNSIGYDSVVPFKFETVYNGAEWGDWEEQKEVIVNTGTESIKIDYIEVLREPKQKRYPVA